MTVVALGSAANEAEAQTLRALRLVSDHMLLAGGSLHRFVDTMDIGWADLAAELNMPEDACRHHMQMILDILFERTRFTASERKLLCRLVETGTVEQCCTSEAKRQGEASLLPSINTPEGMLAHVIQYLQKHYFPAYSVSVISKEYKAMVKLYNTFKKNSQT